MNPLEIIKKQMMQGMTPEKIVMRMSNNNPMIKNLVDMQKKGDTKGVENFARNIFKEKGLDFDKEYSNMRNMFK